MGAANPADPPIEPARPALLVVTTFFPNREFPHRTVFVKNLVASLKRCGESVVVVAPVPYAPPWPSTARFRSLRRIPEEEEIEGIRVLHPRYLVLPKLDVLSGMTFAAAILPALRRLLRSETFYALHVHCAYPDAVGASLVAGHLGLPYIVTAHGSDLNVYARRASLKPQIRWALRRAHGVTAVSQALFEHVQRLLAGTSVQSACIPCAGFSPETFSMRVANAQPPTETLLYVGNLVPIKGLDVLLEALAEASRRQELGSARLVVIGDGPERARLEARAAAGDIAQEVVFLGRLPQPEVARHLSTARLLCLPSHDEGMPNVVIEALASGVPVVASDVGGLSEVVHSGVNGYLVPAGDPVLLARALQEALTQEYQPSELAASVAHFTWNAIALRTQAFVADATTGTGQGAEDASRKRTPARR